ncbi:hypothetical protein [Acidianus sp. HS-5]|uniref:hypothetical protein n=1 Tax=Acidianus sp. HS-5 TaxID=2886040 RepID=UPI001F1F630D|nr:hypothetical protein [Acidianus sp. HS-5]BDC17552.1 hypothetical protein HS5_04420 [Acidianus sp. HS-5]
MLGNTGNTGPDNILKSEGMGARIKNSFKCLYKKAGEYVTAIKSSLYSMNPLSRVGSYLENSGEGSERLYKNGKDNKIISMAKTSKPGGKPLKYVGIAVLLIAIVGGVGYFIFHNMNSQPTVQDVKIDSDYAFIEYDGNDQGTLYYVGPHGNLHDLGTYNLEMKSDFAQALSVPKQFNQYEASKNPNFVPLDQVITIYNPNGVTLEVAHNNTILLNKLNPENYADVVVPSGYLKEYMTALGTGDYKAMHTSAAGLGYLQVNYPQIFNLLGETGNLHIYSPSSADFVSGYIIQTNNNTLIPYGFLLGVNNHVYGGNLPIENTEMVYNGN